MLSREPGAGSRNSHGRADSPHEFPSCLVARASQRGFTLLESIVTIIVVAIALAGVLLVFNFNIMHSADPMIRTQAYDVASAYLDEIMPKDYGACQTSTSRTNRPNWQHVECYDGYSDTPATGGIRDQFYNPVSGLGSYTATVSVTTGVTVCDTSSRCPPAEMVTVTVTHSPNVSISLSAYRLQN